MMRLAVMLAALAVVAAACSGGGTSEKSTATPLVTAGHVDPQNFNGIVLTGAGKASDAGFHGAYKLRATVDGQVIDGTVTWHRKAGRVRADFDGTIGGAQESVIAILIAGANYPAQQSMSLCDSESQTCRDVEPNALSGVYPTEAVPSAVAVRLLDVQAFAAGLNFYDEATRTMLNVPALCFVGRTESTPPGPIDHGEVCLTQDGLPLSVTAAGGQNTVSLTATNVSSGADDSSFQLPYPIATVPG